VDIGFILVTGLVTSFHCVAMCGTMVATYAIKGAASTEKRFDAAPHLVYHSARLVSYTIVGLALGLVGSAFNLGGIRGGASLLAGAFMVLLGMSMLNVHPIFRVFSLRMPRRLQQIMFRGVDDDAGRLGTPLVFGLMTGLMPCGPLQAMQLYAAGTGSAITGAATMLLFGAMTVPMMLAMGAATQMLGHAFKRRVMTVGALIVIVMGLIMLNRGLVLEGSPVSAKTIGSAVVAVLGLGPASSGPEATIVAGVQSTTIVIQNSTYIPDTVGLRAGVPARITIDRRENSSCSDFLVVPSLGINQALKPNGLTTISFTPSGPGRIPFTCGMGMMQGAFDVTAGGPAAAPVAGGAGGAGGGVSAGAPSARATGAVGGTAAVMLLGAIGLFAYTRRSGRAAPAGAKAGAKKKGAPPAAKNGAGAKAAAGKAPAGKAKGKATGGKPATAHAAAASPWSQQYVWIALAVLIAVIAGYQVGTAARGGSAAGLASAGASGTIAQALMDPTGASQSMTMRVAGGYDPAVIGVKAGVPLSLRVVRNEQNACSKYLVFPDLGINQALPDNGTLTVKVPPLPAGTYRFTCGMNMLSGSLVVR
jgi:sulfite exporter TauE/SafE/plastocyanin domain-containing protein